MKESNKDQQKIPIVWIVNGVLLCWILTHALPQISVETLVYPPDAILPDGSRYYGEIEAGKFHGVGKLVWPNGDVYEGAFREGAMSGEGQMRLASGDRLSGSFSEGALNGLGTYQAVSGDYYEGKFVDGYIHGEGRYQYVNKSFYEGEFALGYFHGQGTMHYANGQQFSGAFERGEIVKGEYRDRTGMHYRGEFKDWNYFGAGRLEYSSGDVFEGYFEEGLMVAQGSHRMSDGTFYEGEFLSSLYHGEGRFESKEGETYIGAFEYGQYHGEGVRTFKNRQGEILTQSGRWEYGVFQGDRTKERKRRDIGDALYKQSDLLDDARAELQANNEEAIELYVLAGAGDGSQDVFLKEINYVTQKLVELYSVNGRLLRLINHVDTANDVPLFTLTSMSRSLDAMASAMDTDNDILLMYITSHGSQENGFYVNDRRVNLESMSAKALSDMLNASAIKWRVIIVSACYSGGFIPHLNNENTLVITAARDDRKSFGCSNDSEMTYFGKAFFKESLNPERTFRQAFTEAQRVIERWEDDDGVDNHSEPQIHMGSAIEEHLRLWREQRTGG